MKAKSHQNRFLRIILIPFRALVKARDCYVSSMTSYVDKRSSLAGGMMGVPAANYASMPRSFSNASSRSNESEDFRELVRAASARSLPDAVDLNMYVQQQLTRQASTKAGLQKMPPRSCSVGMARIDEDKPYFAFGEENHVDTKQLVYPRSKTYAVNKRSFVI